MSVLSERPRLCKFGKAIYMPLSVRSGLDFLRGLNPQDLGLEAGVPPDPLADSVWSSPGSSCDLSYDLIYRQVDALGKMGAPYDMYSLGELDSIEGYRLYVVLNTFHLTDEQSASVVRLTHRAGVTTLWFHAPGYLSPDGIRLDRVSKLIGLHASEAAGVAKPTLSSTSALVPVESQPRTFGRETPLDPLFRVEGGTCLATYSGTDVRAAAVVERDGWRSHYFGSAPLPDWVLRHVVRSAGCHQYVTNGDGEVVYVGRSHLVVHTATPGRHVVQFPRAYAVANAVTGKPLARSAGHIDLTCDGPATWILQVGPPETPPGARTP